MLHKHETDIEASEDDGLSRYLDDLGRDADAMQEQGDSADEDMRFIRVDGGMWEDWNENLFSDRVKLELDTVAPHVDRFIAEWNLNRVSVEYKPDDSDTTEEDAELMTGVWTADFRQNSGKMAVDNGVDEVAICGYGAYKIATRFVDEGDPENDLQRIHFIPVNNAYRTVFWDGAAKRIDKRDARWCNELMQFTENSFLDQWPDASLTSAYQPDSWLAGQHGFNRQKIIYVAARYEIIRKKEKVFIYGNLQTGRVEVYTQAQHADVKDELAQDDNREFIRERKIVVQHVDKTVFNGDEILESTRRIAGKYIPIIPMYAYRSYVDGQEHYYGMVRKKKDPARLFNTLASQVAENAAAGGDNTPILYDDEVSGHENEWADRKTLPYVTKNRVYDANGNLIQQAQEYLQPGQLDQNAATLFQIVKEHLGEATGGFPEEILNQQMSGKLFKAIAERKNMDTQPIMDNIANAMEWAGEVFMEQAMDGVYTVERMMRVIGKDGTEISKHLLETVFDEKSGQTIQANNLNGKRFRAYAEAGPQYSSMRERAVEETKELLPFIADDKEVLNAALSAIFMNTDGPNVDSIQKIYRRRMILAGLAKPETDDEKEFIAQLQSQAQQQDPNEELIRAAAKQAESEAEERASKVLDNVASAELKQAKTQETLAGIPVSQEKAEVDTFKTLSDVRNDTLKTLQ